MPGHTFLYLYLRRSIDKRQRQRDSLSGNVPEDGEEKEDDQVHDKDADDNVQKPGVESGDEEVCSSATPCQRALADQLGQATSLQALLSAKKGIKTTDVTLPTGLYGEMMPLQECSAHIFHMRLQCGQRQRALPRVHW